MSARSRGGGEWRDERLVRERVLAAACVPRAAPLTTSARASSRQGRAGALASGSRRPARAARRRAPRHRWLGHRPPWTCPSPQASSCHERPIACHRAGCRAARAGPPRPALRRRDPRSLARVPARRTLLRAAPRRRVRSRLRATTAREALGSGQTLCLRFAPPRGGQTAPRRRPWSSPSRGCPRRLRARARWGAARRRLQGSPAVPPSGCRGPCRRCGLRSQGRC